MFVIIVSFHYMIHLFNTRLTTIIPPSCSNPSQSSLFPHQFIISSSCQTTVAHGPAPYRILVSAAPELNVARPSGHLQCEHQLQNITYKHTEKIRHTQDYPTAQLADHPKSQSNSPPCLVPARHNPRFHSRDSSWERRGNRRSIHQEAHRNRGQKRRCRREESWRWAR